MSQRKKNLRLFSSFVSISSRFNLNEFVENVRLGGGVFPTMANLNHSCDPNLTMVNFGRMAAVVANRPIAEGEQLFDTYGYNYATIEREDRQRGLKVNWNSPLYILS